MTNEISVLGKFRDRRLKPNIIGRHLVKAYYWLSPPIANAIAPNKKLRALVRLSLKPIIETLRRKTHN
jgi:hypothetical protein